MAALRSFRPARAVAVNVGKGARWLARRRGHGGTTLPGLLARGLYRPLVADLAGAIPNGSLVVTGTNGKTTTTRIMAEALRRTGLAPITNREGSNLLRGIATSLLTYADGWGNYRLPEAAIGLFEADEGAFPQALAELRPRVVVLTNLFRDQLDRYFEVDFVASLWAQALAQLPPSTVLALNADDPLVAHLGEAGANPVVYYGLEDVRIGQEGLEHAADSRRCPRCDADLLYGLSFYAHLGHYACPRCGWRRPNPKVAAWRVELEGLAGSRLELVTPFGAQALALPLPGLYNVYNVLAAAAGAFALGVEAAPVREAAAHVEAAFGRMERFTVDGREVLLALVKNPSGFNQVLRTLVAQEPSALAGSGGLLLALNDNLPDGRDVSWIWDVEVERLRGRLGWVVAAGLRAQDLALRLKYGGLLDPQEGPVPELLVVPDVVAALEMALARTPPGQTLPIVPTYTAMWELREELVRRGHLRPFWE